jgi:hypothetical protein
VLSVRTVDGEVRAAYAHPRSHNFRQRSYIVWSRNLISGYRYLQHADRGVTNLLEDELLDTLLPPLRLTHDVHTRSFSLKNVATTTPERKVSSPTEPTAHEMPNVSAMMPTESAPTA